MISKDLKYFFKINLNNVIAFWDYPDSIKWSPHLLLDTESKHIKIDLIFLSKISWEFSRKEECDAIVK